MPDYNSEDLITAGTFHKMMQRYTKLISNPSAVAPHYDASSGRYDNLGDWFNVRRDGLVYGSKSPLFAYSPVTTAIKTDANAGKVLEASTNAEAGRNDYIGIALFDCLRVNGGYDADGMPYVTAIEDYQAEGAPAFDPTENTWIIRPVSYYKITRDSQYEKKEITDTPRDGFQACPGAYTPDGDLRPFILHACYMDSDGACSSKSGTVPAANYSATVDNKVAHCLQNDFNWSRNRQDGLTYLSYADIWYQQIMMEVMLGVKAPREAAVGCVSYNLNYAVAQAEDGVKRVILSDANAANIEVGSAISIGDGTQTDRYYAQMHSIAKSAKVLSKESVGDGKTALNLDLDAAIDVPSTAHIITMPWHNGSCDGVLGTFGAPTEAGLTNGKFPFKFQNQEWQLGIYETVCDMYAKSTVADGETTITWYIAPDVSEPTGINTGDGWDALDTQSVGNSGAWNYIKDYATEKGARVPENVGGTSTQGYRTAWYPASASGNNELLVGGHLSNGSGAGVGCAASDPAVSGTGWHIGGRSSGLGHSAPCAE